MFHSHSTVTPGTPEIQGIDPAKLTPYEKNLAFHAKKIGAPLIRSAVAGYDIGRGLSDPLSIGGGLDIGAGVSTIAAPFLKGKIKTAANIAGALPIVGAMVPGASAEPLRPEQAASGAVDIGTSLLRGPLGMMVSPTELGDATVQPKNEVYYPGMHVLQGSTLPPGHAEGGDIKKSPASIAGTLQEVGTVQGPSLASKLQEHFASLPQTTEDNLRHQQDVMNRAFAGDKEAMNEFTGMMPIGGITSAVKAPITRMIQEFDPRFDPRILEQAKLKNLVTQVEQYQNPNIPKLSLADFEGHPFITSMSDRTAAGGNLVGINNASLNRPVELMGGQDYMFNNPGQVWASGQSPVKQLSNQAQMMRAQTGRDPLYIPWRMSPTGGDFAHMTGETMLAHADTVLDKTSKKELDAAIKNIIPDWKGISHPNSMDQFRNAPSVARKNVQNMIDKDFRDRGALGIGEARLAVADPSQLNAPEGGIQNIGRIFAGKPIIEQSGHASYPHGLPGEGLGVVDIPRNIFELLPNARVGAEQRLVADPKNPIRSDLRALEMKPYSGIITDKLLKSLEPVSSKEKLSTPNLNIDQMKLLVQNSTPTVNRLDMNFKDVTKRIPELTQGAQDLQAGNLTREQYEQLVNTHKPVVPYSFVPKPATAEEAIGALTEDKKAKYGLPSQILQAGHPVGLRLDIPSYTNHGVWVPTVHEQASGFGAGKSIGHESVASVLNPQFGMSEKAAQSIAAGKPKGTIATIKGNWNPVDQETAVAQAQEYLNHPEWRQVGMDPERHGYFYDRETMQPITHAEEALQIGPLVLAKKPVYASKEDFLYAGGGLVALANGGQPDMQSYAPGASRGIAPYGFRHVENVDEVSLPKGMGFMGGLPNQTGQVSTEISASNDSGSYPMLTPNMSRQEINSLLANHQPTDEMYRKAEQFAKYRKLQGKNPFISPVGELRYPLPKE